MGRHGDDRENGRRESGPSDELGAAYDRYGGGDKRCLKPRPRQQAGEEKNLGLTEAITKSWDAMQNTIARFQSAVYQPDVLVEIPANACAFWEFHRARELIELGRERAERALSDL